MGLAYLAILAAGAAIASSSSFPAKPYGLLILAEGNDPAWKATAEGIRKKLEDKTPFQIAFGEADARALRRAVKALEAQRAQKIITVPIFLSSFSEAMEQSRILLGVAAAPKPSVAPERARTKLAELKPIEVGIPLVMTEALDDDPIVADILVTRAKSVARGARTSVLLVAQSPSDAQAAKLWRQSAESLAEKVRVKGGFTAVEVAALPINDRPEDRRAAEAQLRKRSLGLRGDGPIVVLPLELTPGDVSRAAKRALSGLFARYDGKGMLPDARITAWVQSSFERGSRMADMRILKGPRNGALAPAQSGGYQ
ncbi:MAG: hypothetical protein HY549_11165 [Elusimicrobia bacterium]|nr:hypothetical protein [Elusimicrobiota bacterium]